MIDGQFTTSFVVDQTPEEAFAAINNVGGWWTGQIEGETCKVGNEFTYRYADVHRSRQRVTVSIPGQRVVWHVVDGYLNFAQDTSEWTGTDIIFEIAAKDEKTEALHSCRPGPGTRMFRQLLERVGLLHQWKPAKSDDERAGPPNWKWQRGVG